MKKDNFKINRFNIREMFNVMKFNDESVKDAIIESIMIKDFMKTNSNERIIEKSESLSNLNDKIVFILNEVKRRNEKAETEKIIGIDRFNKLILKHLSKLKLLEIFENLIKEIETKPENERIDELIELKHNYLNGIGELIKRQNKFNNEGFVKNEGFIILPQTEKEYGLNVAEIIDNKINELRKPETKIKHSFLSSADYNIKFNLTQTEFTELVKALCDNGNIKGSQDKAIKYLANVFGLENKYIDGFYNRYQEIQVRKANGSNTTIFLDKLKKSFEEELSKPKK